MGVGFADRAAVVVAVGFSQDCKVHVPNPTHKIVQFYFGDPLRRNCLLKLVVQGKEGVRVEVKGRRGRRRKQLLVDRKAMRGYRKLKGKALDHI